MDHPEGKVTKRKGYSLQEQQMILDRVRPDSELATQLGKSVSSIKKARRRLLGKEVDYRRAKGRGFDLVDTDEL